MKKILSTLIIAFSIYFSASAQIRTSDEFGLNIGYNAANVYESGSNYHSDYNSGVNLGFSAEHYFSDSWSIKGKLIYDQKGWGNGYLTFPDGSEIDGVNFHLNYLTVPVMANWHFGRTRNWYLHFGPYVGFLLNATESSNSGVDVKSAFNNTEVGFDAGIGVKFPVSNHVKLFIELDGQAGFNNLFKESDSSVQTERSSINFGMLFPIK
jgi:opacity protein-like surface antigen